MVATAASTNGPTNVLTKTHQDSSSLINTTTFNHMSPSTQHQLISNKQQSNNKTEDAAAATKSQLPNYLKAIGMDPRKFWPKKYRFTREKSPGFYNPLNIGQRNFYENNGYIVLDDCINSKLLKLIKQHYNKTGAVNNDTNSNVINLSDSFLLEKLAMRNSSLIQYVKCFCDERTLLMTANIISTFQSNESVRQMIESKLQQQQQLFRDWIYLPFRPIDKVVCTITAIDPIEHVILVVPGTHRVGQCTISSTLNNLSRVYDSSQERSEHLISREVFECNPENLSALVEESKKGSKYINLKPGQTLFYHPGLVHGFSNDLINFKKKQMALIAYYAAADCEYIDLRSSNELMNSKLKPITLAHFGDKNPSDYASWMDKPKLLRDKKASL